MVWYDSLWYVNVTEVSGKIVLYTYDIIGAGWQEISLVSGSSTVTGLVPYSASINGI